MTAYVGPDDLVAGARQREIDVFFRQLRWVDRYLKFAGADIFEFYHVGEWVSGPNDWRMRVHSVSGVAPPDERYLEVVLEYQPGANRRRDEPLELDLTAAVSLIDGSGRQARPAGVVAPLIDGQYLISDSTALSRLAVFQPSRGAILRLAFEVPDRAAEYFLRTAGFAPIRIWVPGTQ